MRLGEVVINAGYTVDLDDPDMIENAKKIIAEEITSEDNLNNFFQLQEKPDAKESDIPGWLKTKLHLSEDDLKVLVSEEITETEFREFCKAMAECNGFCIGELTFEEHLENYREWISGDY